MKEKKCFLAFPNFWIFWIFLDFFGVKKTKHCDEPRRPQIVTQWHVILLFGVDCCDGRNRNRDYEPWSSWLTLTRGGLCGRSLADLLSSFFGNHFRECDYPKMLRFLPWAWLFILNEIRVRRLFPPTLMYQFALLSKINMLVNIKKGRKANNEVSTYIIYILYA